MTALGNPRLGDGLPRPDGVDADALMDRGVCPAICPMGVDVEVRRLFRYVLLGMEDKVRAETERVFSCLLCRMCEENCPAGVHIAENVRTLRHHIVRTGFGLGEG